MGKQRHAEVIGAGLGGLTAAAALARNGWSVRLHERQSEIRAAGAGIYVWDNGLSALEAVGAFTGATRGAHIGPAVEGRSHLGNTLYRIGINAEGGPRCFTLLRDRLIRSLVAAAEDAGVEVVTGSTATRAHPDGRVEFRGSPDVTADLVVAADGVHSRLRDQLRLVERRIRMKQGAARMMIPASPEHVPAGDAPLHLEYFRGRRRLLYTPCTPDSTYVALVSDTTDEATRESPVNALSWHRSFPTLGPLIEELGRATARWDTFELIRLRSWSCGRVALLGDSAHAQPPYLGQGGGTAMTNAVALAAEVSRRDIPLGSALVAWENKRRPGVEQTQRTSYRMRLLNAVPDVVRNPLLSAAGRSPLYARPQLAATRIRTSLSSSAIHEPERSR
ncbi:NAD(P)/FAD-dependent oxidoreductase [Streptomyces sp. NPDC032161]|uniref:FAD-dependent oxidoreductase n=1 Tax=unclassified Streptomyces TaxID=2593676 RepID=UPI0033D66773